MRISPSRKRSSFRISNFLMGWGNKTTRVILAFDLGVSFGNSGERVVADLQHHPGTAQLMGLLVVGPLKRMCDKTSVAGAPHGAGCEALRDAPHLTLAVLKIDVDIFQIEHGHVRLAGHLQGADAIFPADRLRRGSGRGLDHLLQRHAQVEQSRHHSRHVVAGPFTGQAVHIGADDIGPESLRRADLADRPVKGRCRGRYRRARRAAAIRAPRDEPGGCRYR